MIGPPDSAASLARWLRWLETLSPREIDLGLERVAEVLERLALPRPERVFTIGGTNGKGSSVAMLDALLQECGDSTGSYTSPHVLHYAERIRINGVPVGEQDIVLAFEQVEAVRGDRPLTYFEYGTLAALCVFAKAEVSSLILEVGLGGRLDAVNAVEHDGCLITNVTLDHCDWLGTSVEAIAAEKAGIMRRGKVSVFGSEDRPAAIDRAARAADADLIASGRDYSMSKERDGRWSFRGREWVLGGLEPPRLEGAHQYHNAAAVLALFEATHNRRPLSVEAVNCALGAAVLPGRLQRVDARRRRWLLDGAHNAAGAAALAAAIAAADEPRVVAVTGILKDKDVDAIIGSLTPQVDQWIAVTAESARAIPAYRLALAVAGVSGRPCRVASSLEDGLKHAVAATGPDDLIVVAGSFFTVAAAMRSLLEQGPSDEPLTAQPGID